MSVMPPDNRAPGTGSPALDFDQLNDVVALLLEFAAMFNTPLGSAPAPAFPGGNAANLAALQNLIATQKVQIAQQGNQTAFLLSGTPGVLSDICRFQDPFGNVMFGVGIQGVYGNGNGFYAYDRYGTNYYGTTCLGGGESFTGGGTQNYAPMASPLTGAAPGNGANVMNWAGVQDDWSGLDMDMYLPITFNPTTGAAATVTVNIGATLTLNSPLSNGSIYTSLTVLPTPAAVPISTNLTLIYGNGVPAGGTTQGSIPTGSVQNGYGATVVPMVSFTANANYPSFNPQGNGYMQTTYAIMGVFSPTFPWNQQIISESVPAWGAGPSTAGTIKVLRFKVPNRWFFSVNATNCTIGNLVGISC